MLQRLPKALAQEKAGNTPKHLLNEFRQMIYYLHWLKETTKKVCNSIMNSTKLWCKITIIFMNSENSKTCDPYRLIENLPEKK